MSAIPNRMLKKILLPNTELAVSQFSIGTPQWGSVLVGERLESLFTGYVEAGGNFFDTAHCYAFWRDGLGASETSLGHLVRRHCRREDVVIATKCGHPFGGPQYPRPVKVLSPEMISADLSESLSRLKMDRLDLFYVHRDDSSVPVAEIMDALNIHIRSGQVRCLGASNWTAARIAEANVYAEAHGLAGFVVSQPQWSLAQPNAPVPTSDPAMRYLTAEERAWHVATGFPLVAYTSSANGYISDAPKPASAAFDNPTSQSRRARAMALAAKFGVTPNAIALAYLISQPFPVIPILGTMDLSHLKEAMLAAEISLTPRQVGWLETGEETLGV
ncbi:MAG TPA: aldo/keto reductase [Candidatus Methylacidiphilales bacterium]